MPLLSGSISTRTVVSCSEMAITRNPPSVSPVASVTMPRTCPGARGSTTRSITSRATACAADSSMVVSAGASTSLSGSNE